MPDKKITAYAAFWPFYLEEHSKRETRALHYVGTALAIGCLIGAAVLAEPWLLLGAVFSGYFFAWTAHFFVEHNRPATFTYPLWSLVSDFRMFFLWVGGRLGGHLERYRIEARE